MRPYSTSNSLRASLKVAGRPPGRANRLGPANDQGGNTDSGRGGGSMNAWHSTPFARRKRPRKSPLRRLARICARGWASAGLFLLWFCYLASRIACRAARSMALTSLRRALYAAVFRPCVSLFCDPGGGPFGRPVRRWGRLKSLSRPSPCGVMSLRHRADRLSAPIDVLTLTGNPSPLEPIDRGTSHAIGLLAQEGFNALAGGDGRLAAAVQLGVMAGLAAFNRRKAARYIEV
jgi:hypothetical protein